MAEDEAERTQLRGLNQEIQFWRADMRCGKGNLSKGVMDYIFIACYCDRSVCVFQIRGTSVRLKRFEFSL